MMEVIKSEMKIQKTVENFCDTCKQKYLFWDLQRCAICDQDICKKCSDFCSTGFGLLCNKCNQLGNTNNLFNKFKQLEGIYNDNLESVEKLYHENLDNLMKSWKEMSLCE